MWTHPASSTPTLHPGPLPLSPSSTLPLHLLTLHPYPLNFLQRLPSTILPDPLFFSLPLWPGPSNILPLLSSTLLFFYSPSPFTDSTSWSTLFFCKDFPSPIWFDPLFSSLPLRPVPLKILHLSSVPLFLSSTWPLHLLTSLSYPLSFLHSLHFHCHSYWCTLPFLQFSTSVLYSILLWVRYLLFMYSLCTYFSHLSITVHVPCFVFLFFVYLLSLLSIYSLFYSLPPLSTLFLFYFYSISTLNSISILFLFFPSGLFFGYFLCCCLCIPLPFL